MKPVEQGKGRSQRSATLEDPGAPQDPATSEDFREQMAYGFRTAIPLAVAVFGFGVSFGVVAHAAHLGRLVPLTMSATVFAGSAQFAAVSVLGTGGGVAAAVVAAALLNIRYLPIGMSLAPAITGGPLRRLLTAQLVVDETWAVSHLGGGRFSRGRLLGAGIPLYLGWLGGTALGVFGAGFLGDPSRFGLDVVSPVLFLALLRGQVDNRRTALFAAAGAAVALVLVPLVSPGLPLLAAAGVCLFGLRRPR